MLSIHAAARNLSIRARHLLSILQSYDPWASAWFTLKNICMKTIKKDIHKIPASSSRWKNIFSSVLWSVPCQYAIKSEEFVSFTNHCHFSVISAKEFVAFANNCQCYLFTCNHSELISVLESDASKLPTVSRWKIAKSILRLVPRSSAWNSAIDIVICIEPIPISTLSGWTEIQEKILGSKDKYKDKYKDIYKDKYKHKHKDTYKDKYKNKYKEKYKDKYKDKYKEKYKDKYKTNTIQCAHLERAIWGSCKF